MLPSKVLSLLGEIPCLLRRFRCTLQGVSLGPGCRLGRGVKLGKRVVIGSNVEIGDWCVIDGPVKLSDQVCIQKHVEISGRVEIGESTVIAAYTYLSTMPGAMLSIGRDVLVNSFTIVGAAESVMIADDCIFAPYVHITDASHSFEYVSSSPRHDSFHSKPVTIGHGVWLGSAVKVLMGVAIGEGAVVGAGAVVTRNVPPWAVSVGVPAKTLRFRKNPVAIQEVPEQ
jgi:acetyltransferase-like isoleucine patch superfamily enzyme